MTTTMITSAQSTFYRTATSAISSPGDRVRAGVQAIKSTPLEAEGMSEEFADAVVFLLEDSAAVLRAITDMGPLTEDEQDGFGFNLAEVLLENDLNDMVARARSEYLLERQLVDSSGSGADVYEINDPKHPNYLDRLGL